MTLLDLLVYRGTVIVLNAIALAIALGLVVMAAAAPGAAPGGGIVFPLAAPLLGILAFATPRRHKGLLVAAIVVNLLHGLLVFPFLMFGAMGQMPFGWFAALAFQYFCVPVLTIAAALVGWPKRVAR